MSVSNVFYERISFSPTIPTLPQFREPHQENYFVGQVLIIRDSHESLVRASTFIQYLERNLNAPKGSKSPLQALLERSLHLPATEENELLFSEITHAFFKQKGYLSRLFSNESWEEWFENRTALGKVASQFRNCIESRAEVCSFTKEINPQLIQKANEESSVLLKGLRSRDVTRTSKGSCLYGLTSGIAASFLLENPFPLVLGISECFPRAHAQQKVGSEFQVNTYTNSSQDYPSVASFSNGNFVVIWNSFGQDSSEYGVFGQIFNDNITYPSSSTTTSSSTTSTTKTTSSTTPSISRSTMSAIGRTRTSVNPRSSRTVLSKPTTTSNSSAPSTTKTTSSATPSVSSRTPVPSTTRQTTISNSKATLSATSDPRNRFSWIWFLLGGVGAASCLSLTGYFIFKSKDRKKEGDVHSLELGEREQTDDSTAETHYQSTPDFVTERAGQGPIYAHTPDFEEISREHRASDSYRWKGLSKGMHVVFDNAIGGKFNESYTAANGLGHRFALKIVSLNIYSGKPSLKFLIDLFQMR